MALGKKLFLDKETISLLNTNQQQGVQGGATVEASVCLACNTQPAISRCAPCESLLLCPTQPRVSCLINCGATQDNTPSVCVLCH